MIVSAETSDHLEMTEQLTGEVEGAQESLSNYFLVLKGKYF